ncbi:MAG: hypothetical protein FWE52_04225 [Alphaproteobacteria bacterium]|nr:hypothetical protein [Alphaproteobacteria bacterium]
MIDHEATIITDDFNKATGEYALAHAIIRHVFKSPKNGRPAAVLLDQVGLKGYRLSYSDTCVSFKHANWIKCYARSTPTEVIRLMLLMYRLVDWKFEIKLLPNVIYQGNSPVAHKALETMHQGR